MLDNRKTLIFEGAGWSGAEASIKSGVGNCRIRTRIKNNEGRIIYLEMGGWNRHKYTPKQIPFNIIGRIDHCFYEDINWDKRDCHSPELSKLEGLLFEYNKENILQLVNEKLNCNFTDIKVINDNSINVHNTDKPLSDCSKPNTKPFKDEPILFEIIKHVEPKNKYSNPNVADYHIDFDHIKNLEFAQRFITEKIDKDGFYLRIRHNNNEITSVELTHIDYTFPCVRLDKETARKLINCLS